MKIRTFEEKFGDLIDIMSEKVHSNAVAKGFWVEENKGEKYALMHSEISEALEATRNGLPMDKNCPNFTNEVIELADTVIRIMDYCKHFKLDLAGAIIAKHKYNLTRPYKHGKAF